MEHFPLAELSAVAAVSVVFIQLIINLYADNSKAIWCFMVIVVMIATSTLCWHLGLIKLLGFHPWMFVLVAAWAFKHQEEVSSLALCPDQGWDNDQEIETSVTTGHLSPVHFEEK